MPKTRIGEVSASKDAHLKLRLTPTIDKRLATLSGMTGETKTSIAGTAMVMGLRLLENEIMGEKLAAATLEEAADLLRSQLEADIDLLVSEAAQRDAKAKSDAEPAPEKPPLGLRPRADVAEVGSFALLEDMLALR